MDQVGAYFDKPFAFFGHSMGGLLAFELTKKLILENKPVPEKLYISSTPQLASYDREQINPNTSDDNLMDLFPYLKGSNGAHDSAEKTKIMINILRADLELLSDYQYKKEIPIPVPIIALHGVDDPRVKHEHMELWHKETTGSFELLSRPGGHRYIDQEGEFITSLIKDKLTEVVYVEK